MSRAGNEPPRSVPYSSTPPPSSRRRPAPSVLSPLSSLSTTSISSPNDSFRSTQSSYQPSLVSHSGFSLLSGSAGGPSLSRYLPSSASAAQSNAGFSGAISHAGSIATTANPNGPARFRRGHAKKKVGGVQTPPAVRTNNPDEVDLMALEEPDEVFRMFGVRDVRKLEKRASDAASAKVADLRTMVGERYRDLLAAADSIVRMRSAAEKLVDRLDNVEDAVLGAGRAIDDTPTKTAPPSRRPSRRSLSPSRSRTLSSAPTLSLTIHLLLTIPSSVHSALSSASFLDAARLETLGRAVYRELSEYQPDFEGVGEDGEGGLVDEEGRLRSIREAFPIVEKQSEALSALGPLVVRRAMGELRGWDLKPVDTAQTLAALVLLHQETSPSAPFSALSTLLAARSDALSALLNAPSSSTRSDTAGVVASLEQVLGLVLRTVETVAEVFGVDEREGLLAKLLREVQRPSLPPPSSAALELPRSPAGDVDGLEGESTALAPILAAFPNYTTLARHLPQSLLFFAPALSPSSSFPSPSTVEHDLSAWLAQETARVVSGVTSWLSTLSSPSSPQAGAGAKTLSALRAALSATLSSSTASSASAAASLHAQLSRAIEARLKEVYTAQLDSLVARVRPGVEALLLALPGDESAPDREAAKFLFDAPLPFPTTSSSVASHGAAAPTGADPFDVFLARVTRRVQGRSPLVDRGVRELEKAAQAIKADLEGWLGASPSSSSSAAGAGEEEDKLRLRSEYLSVARFALEGIADALEAVLREVQDGAVDEALFVGNFAGAVARGGGVARGVLLGEIGSEGSVERTLLAAFHTRLSALQDRSLEAWRAEAVRKAVRKLEEGMNEVYAAQERAAAWAWEATRPSAANLSPSPLPLFPSSTALSALHSLSTSLSLLPLYRRADHSIARGLVAAFAAEAERVAGAFAGVLEKQEGGRQRREVARQAAWDVRLLRKVVEISEKSAAVGGWEAVEEQFLHLASSTSEDAAALSAHLSTSTLSYLQRTQSLFAPLLPSSSLSSLPPPVGTTTAAAGPKPTVPVALSRLLPLGPPPSSTTAGASAVGTPGLVKPGPRLGLLPTRG
ncbi:hypothetical protein JCM6882_000277 [Rhodosporidiobolus microsporus]